MLPVQAVEAEQLARRDDHLMRQQALEHTTDIDPTQRAHPDRCTTLRLDEMQGITQSLLQQQGHLILAVIEQPPQHQQVLINATAAIQTGNGFLAYRRESEGPQQKVPLQLRAQMP
ncbi:hypothetical protein D9M71_433120 [compost metagenome]